MHHFFSYLSRMKYIKRWGLMRNSQEENIQEHSLQVAMIAHSLALIENRLFGGALDPDHICVLAVYHETSEVITGDLATPIKYFNPKISQAYKEIEGIANEKMLSMLPEELRQDYTPLLNPPDKASYDLVKAADRISAYCKCLEEMKAGNREFERAMNSIRESIDQFQRPCVQYFMDHFIDSFSLTLDELN